MFNVHKVNDLNNVDEFVELLCNLLNDLIVSCCYNGHE